MPGAESRISAGACCRRRTHDARFFRVMNWYPPATSSTRNDRPASSYFSLSRRTSVRASVPSAKLASWLSFRLGNGSRETNNTASSRWSLPLPANWPSSTGAAARNPHHHPNANPLGCRIAAGGRRVPEQRTVVDLWRHILRFFKSVLNRTKTKSQGNPANKTARVARNRRETQGQKQPKRLDENSFHCLPSKEWRESRDARTRSDFISFPPRFRT